MAKPGIFGGEVENKSGLFEIFKRNSPVGDAVVITFPDGQSKVAFRNYKNLEERRQIKADATNEGLLYFEQSRAESGPFVEFGGLEQSDFIAAVVLSHLCLGEVGEDGEPDGTSNFQDWMRCAAHNASLFAWVIEQVDLAMFGLLRSMQAGELNESKKK